MPDVAPREIERKFLVRQLPQNLESFAHRLIEQGYLLTKADGRQIRLRRAGDRYSLTYKGTVTNGAREEREIDLEQTQFQALWPATVGRRLSKIRYEIPYHDLVVELDVYQGSHDGLVVVEVEFPNENSRDQFRPPPWLGDDVTGDGRYANSKLAG